MAQNNSSVEIPLPPPISGTPSTDPAPPTSAPPPAYYPPCSSDAGAQTDTLVNLPLPPSYDAAANLPSYEEAERSKAEEAALGLSTPVIEEDGTNRRRLWGGRGGRRAGTLGELLWGVPRREPGNAGNLSHSELQRIVLGTDMEFLCCFLIALVFNGLGLLCALCCLTASIAGRSGAIAGFGLSIIKWGLLVLHQKKYDNAWLMDTYQTYGPGVTADFEDVTKRTADTITFTCWLIIALGVLFFLQGVIHYVKAKRCSRDINWLKQRYFGSN